MLLLSFQFFIVFCCSTLIYSIATGLLQGAIRQRFLLFLLGYAQMVCETQTLKFDSRTIVEVQSRKHTSDSILLAFLKLRRQFFKVTKSESTKEEDFLCGRYPNRTSSCSINKRKSVIVRRNIRNYRNVALVHGNLRRAGLFRMARRQILQ